MTNMLMNTSETLNDIWWIGICIMPTVAVIITIIVLICVNIWRCKF